MKHSKKENGIYFTEDMLNAVSEEDLQLFGKLGQIALKVQKEWHEGKITTKHNYDLKLIADELYGAL